MNLDHESVQVSKLNETEKRKRSSPKMEHFFPRIEVDTYAQMQTVVKLLGGGDISLIPPAGLGSPVSRGERVITLNLLV